MIALLPTGLCIPAVTPLVVRPLPLYLLPERTTGLVTGDRMTIHLLDATMCHANVILGDQAVLTMIIVAQ